MKKKLKFEKLDAKGIPLAEIILAHRQFSGGIADNLGDSFLYTLNPIYRNVRDDFLRRGFTFTQENLGGYFSFPLMALDDVMAAGVVPYRANFPWLEILEKRAPGKFTLTELKRSELQFNYLFHESAHFIAHSVFFGKTKLVDVPKNQDSLLRILIGESFANVVEAMSAALAQGEIASYFLDANCHFRSSEKEVATILRAAKRFGFEATARVLLGAFLYSNFLHEKLNARQVAKIHRFSRLPKSALISPLVKIGLQLSEQFRTTTTQLHLVKVGFIDLKLGFDPIDRLLKDSTLVGKTEELVQVICAGLAKKVEFQKSG